MPKCNLNVSGASTALIETEGLGSLLVPSLPWRLWQPDKGSQRKEESCVKPLLQSCQRAGIRFIYPARQRPQHRNLKATQAWLHNNYVEVPELPEESPDFYPVLGFVAGIQILSPNASAALIELYVQMNREREGWGGARAHVPDVQTSPPYSLSDAEGASAACWLLDCATSGLFLLNISRITTLAALTCVWENPFKPIWI